MQVYFQPLGIKFVQWFSKPLQLLCWVSVLPTIMPVPLNNVITPHSLFHLGIRHHRRQSPSCCRPEVVRGCIQGDPVVRRCSQAHGRPHLVPAGTSPMTAHSRGALGAVADEGPSGSYRRRPPEGEGLSCTAGYSGLGYSLILYEIIFLLNFGE